MSTESRRTGPPETPSVGDEPREVTEKLNNRAANNTGVTSTSHKPGAKAVPAGTTLPVADFANDSAKNAGKKIDSQPSGVAISVCIRSF